MLTSKSEPLCWGQHYHFLRYHQVPESSRHEAHITTSYPLPEGCTVEQATAALNHLVRRHEVLRTVYDPQGRPTPSQRVDPPAAMTVHEATTEDDGTPPPTEVIGRLSRTPFDIARDWPMRACVITTGGVLKRLHLVFNHLAFDDVGLDVLSADLDALLAGRAAARPVTLPPVRYQPVDLARYESGRPARAVRADLDHWQGELRRLPADVFALRRGPAREPDAAHSASFTVPSLLATARAIAGRHRVWPSAVHLAAYAVTLAAYTGERLVAHRMYTSQRDASGYASVLTCLSYPTLGCLDLTGDPSFSTVLRRAATRVEQSMAHAHVPYDQVHELISRESWRRGQELRVASELNFLDNAPRSCRTRRDRLAWNAAPADWARAGSDLYFRIYEWGDGITLALQAMDAVMDRQAVEGFLRGYTELLRAHQDPGTDLSVGQAAELMDFAPLPPCPVLRFGPDTVYPERTAAVLLEHDAVQSARVHRTDRGLAADVSVGRPTAPDELRAHVLGAVYDRAGVRCPDWFRITAADGRFPTAEGDGRRAAPRPARTEAEQALSNAMARVNGLDRVDLADSYTAAGGRALRMPSMLAALRELGWAGATVPQLAGALPLRTIADRMERCALSVPRPTTTR